MSSFFPQSTFFGLDMMATSLQSFSVAENVTSDNISNVNTPGASRQQVDLNEQVPLVGPPFMATHVYGTAGQGAIISQIERIHSDAYDAMFRGATASQNYYSTQQTSLKGLQAILGDPNAGISVQYGNFQSSIAQLISQAGSGNPTAARSNVLNTAQALASSLGTASNAITTQEQTVLQQSSALVTKVNGILDQIAALNGQIRESTAVGDSPNTFADQRDYLIDQLSQYLTTQTSIQTDGSTLVTVNGQALVNDTVTYHLAAPVVGQAANGQPTFKIDFASNPTAPATATGIPLGSGQLGAFQDLYNNKLLVYGNQLDQFASSLANEVNRITQGAYDQNGNAGTALFQPIVANLPITAGNIKCGISDPNLLPVALANTSAGNLVVPMNSANNTVDTSQAIVGNGNLANPPAAGFAGTLNVQVDNIPGGLNFAYNTAAGGNADTIDHFITNFNNAQLGVTASFDSASQRIVFARDPENESLALRAKQGSNAQTPDFTITDSNWVGAPAPPNPSASLLGILGAQALQTANGPAVGVNQNATNAFAASDNGGANALVKVFQFDVGIGALVTKGPAGGAAANALTTVTLSVTQPSGVNYVRVGDVLQLDSGTANQENVVVSAVSFAGGTESVSFTPTLPHGANYTVVAAPVETLQQYYGGFISQVGIDTQTAITGTTSQTNLTKNIDATRQSISGINLDEETQNLIKYQSAYQAAAKTIATMNQLLNTIITGLGVGG